MYLNLSALPLPSLSDPRAGRQRRHRIGGLDLDRRALRRFQDVAQSLQSPHPTPGADAIASAARSLSQQFVGARKAPCIRLRLRCLTAFRAMSTEEGWQLDAIKKHHIASIVGYSSSQQRLIPDAIPVVGGLDDALLVELAWPSLRLDLDDYLSFRRLRVEEARLRGLHPHDIGYDREQWLRARFAQLVALIRHRRRGLASHGDRSAHRLFRIG